MPNHWLNLNVSRHHCVFDIDPPHVHVRDLGSRNGTYVNGRKIGQRQRSGADTVRLEEMPDVALDDGDDVRIGNAVVRVATDTGSSSAEREVAE
jgi:eukaryotic-like serine/threonine-protein kinase